MFTRAPAAKSISLELNSGLSVVVKTPSCSSSLCACICFFSSGGLGVGWGVYLSACVYMCSWEGKMLAKAQGLVSRLVLK